MFFVKQKTAYEISMGPGKFTEANSKTTRAPKASQSCDIFPRWSIYCLSRLRQPRKTLGCARWEVHIDAARPCGTRLPMLFLRRLEVAGKCVKGYHVEGLGCTDGKAVDGSARAQGRGVCSRLESRWRESGQWRQG